MKGIKIFAILGIAGAATMLAAASASADTLTGPNGETTPTIHFVSEGHVKTQAFVNIECPSTFEGVVTAHEAGQEVQGGLNVLTFGHVGNPCTNSWHATVVAPGAFEVESIAPGEGIVKSIGMTTSKTRLGVTCNFVSNGTTIGTFTDSTKAANGLGTIDISTSLTVHSGSSGLCGVSSVHWSGSYASTTKLTLDNT